MTEHTNETIQALRQNIRYFLKWTFISAISGVTIGLAGTLFGLGIQKATAFWKSHSWTLYLLPLVGLLIVWLYRFAHEEKNRGTDMVLDSISSTEEVTPATAPLIFISTLLSHLATASVGREGAALQLGGSLGNLIGKAFRLDEKDRKIAIMCGMSAGFSAIFGTPLAAAVFAMEVISIGVMYYAALVPCVFSAFVGVSVAKFLGLAPEHYEIGLVPEFGASSALLTVLIGILCACVGIFLCVSLHQCGHAYRKVFPNPYIRVLAGSAIFIVLTLLFPARLYNGSGAQIIEMVFEGEKIPVYAFLMKILFTGVALGAGFKGGEIVPTLTVGAAFGYLMSLVTGLPVGLCASVGMACLFVSVTNCPVSTMFMAFELFGFAAMPYYAIAVAVCFTLSGYYGLYHSQKFVYSKIRTEFITENQTSKYCRCQYASERYRHLFLQ